MRSIGLLFFAVVVASLSFGQIPNAGFESWTTDPDGNVDPVGWQTTNSFPFVNVEPFAPGYRGTYAMKVKTADAGFPIPGMAILEAAYAFAQAPRRFSAYVKSNIMPGDQALIIVALMRGDSVIASTDSCTFKINSTYSQFTYLDFPIAIQSTLVPDSLIIMVVSGLANGQVGTELIVDEMAFVAGGSSDVLAEEILPRTLRLQQNYPNPFNPTTVVRYQLPVASRTDLRIYDLLGREVAVLVNEEMMPGTYTATWDASSLTSGVYFYQLRAGAFVETRRCLLLR